MVRPDGITVLAAVLYFAVFPHRLDLSGSWLAAAYGGEMDAQTLRRELGVSNLSYMLETGLFAVTLAPASICSQLWARKPDGADI